MSASASSPTAALLARAERADQLRSASPAAAQPLRFIAGLFRAQARVAELLAGAELTGQLSEDAGFLVEPARRIVRYAAESGPALLAEVARERGAEDAARFSSRLLIYWQGGLDSREDYLSRALLRPWCAVLAARSLEPQHEERGCPFCGGAPSVAVRRPEADATRRLLACARCGREWPVNRIVCPACAEADPVKLPQFQSGQHPFVRIEACDTCHRYLKSIDLSQDGRLIPEVDELSSLGMDLWAVEQGYSRIEPGLAGI